MKKLLLILLLVVFVQSIHLELRKPSIPRAKQIITKHIKCLDTGDQYDCQLE